MVDKVDCWYWLVQTPKGDFFMSVVGGWTQEEAALKVWKTFDQFNLTIIGLVQRKRVPFAGDSTGSIYQDKTQAEGEFFLAGKKFWEISGRGTEYAAQMVALDHQIKESRTPSREK